MPCPCHAHAFPRPCRAAKGLECLSHSIYTVRPCLFHTCCAPMLSSDHAVLLKATAQHGPRGTAMLCRDLEKNGMVRAWHLRGLASVNHTRPHCVNQMGKTHSKPLAARHGRGKAWARHGYGMLCVNWPLTFRHCASCILGQAFRYSPEKAFYIFNQQIYFII